ncbi:DUF3955 domain-containing protein [Aliiroseovarius sediminis]|uniref:DUF3955 domain-containing protein n=1 Tax=Aliiroseovarius sediminis TaxID=2925839 RepID=UPI001F585CEB|nr:DUF3955 domain-containing protein [Aliiroseovarius sediminis]MCI2393006.1 DUF3955 domain-containing protein [Aliiroseovarius sediminis]
MRHLLRTFGIVAITFAIAFWYAEKALFGGIDPDGTLQESAFLPMTYFLGVIGLISLVASFAVKPKR